LAISIFNDLQASSAALAAAISDGPVYFEFRLIGRMWDDRIVEAGAVKETTVTTEPSPSPSPSPSHTHSGHQ
jgi:hypothetical protein